MSAERAICAPELEAELIAAARAALPREACGLLLGRRGSDVLCSDGVRILAAHPARNLEPGLDRFRVHPEDHLAAEHEAQRLGLEVIGAWHSHPRGRARRSAADREGSPPCWWLGIVGFGGGAVPELAWFPPHPVRARYAPED